MDPPPKKKLQKEAVSRRKQLLFVLEEKIIGIRAKNETKYAENACNFHDQKVTCYSSKLCKFGKYHNNVAPKNQCADGLKICHNIVQVPLKCVIFVAGSDTLKGHVTGKKEK